MNINNQITFRKFIDILTTEVENLLEQIGYPGMRVLQFAFDGLNKNFTKNKHLPHHYKYNCIYRNT